jgi:hypothetical protein
VQKPTLQKLRVICASAAFMWMTQLVEAATPADYISAAVAAAGRPAADRQRDVNRQPAAVIAFAGLKPGDKVADFLPGRGYFTKIFCTIVGEAGHVYAISAPFKRPAAASSSSSASSVQVPDQTCSNITTIMLQGKNQSAPELYSRDDDPGAVYEYRSQRPAVENFTAAEPLDMIWTIRVSASPICCWSTRPCYKH